MTYVFAVMYIGEIEKIFLHEKDAIDYTKGIEQLYQIKKMELVE